MGLLRREAFLLFDEPRRRVPTVVGTTETHADGIRITPAEW